MKKNFWAIYIPVMVLICGVICYSLYNGGKENKEVVSNTFMNEYNSLNGQSVSGTDFVYPDTQINENNIYYYASEDEIKSLFDGGSGVIYFGFPTCPWCRNIVGVLDDAVSSYGIDKIYYYNIKGIRTTAVLDDDNSVIIENNGSEFYYYLLDKLDSYLTNYELDAGNKKTVKVGEKRLYAPTVVFIKEGKILGMVEGTVDGQNNPYILLNDEQKNELSLKYQEYLKQIAEVCDEKC